MVKKFNATNTGKLLNKTDNDDEIKDSEDKIASITNWATTAALTAVENKIQNITTKTLLLLSKKPDYDAKISSIEEKWFPLTDYNKFTNDIIDAKTREKSYLTNLILMFS